MGSLSRRRFLQGAAVLPAAAALAHPAQALAATPPVLEQHTFAVPGLDPAHDGLRVAQISDVHVGWLTPREHVRFAVEAANAFQPDLVALTGDYLTLSRSGLELMRDQLAGLRAPTVAVLGNHDWYGDGPGAARELRGLGYGVLSNENTTLTLRGAPFTVIGIDDERTRHADVDRAFAGARAGSRLVLAHVPRTSRRIVARGEPVLVLSGHTHGGQIRIPGLTAALIHGLMREPWDSGWFRVGATQIYVSRGLGNSGLPLRVDAPPEVTLITLRREEAGA